MAAESAAKGFLPIRPSRVASAKGRKSRLILRDCKRLPIKFQKLLMMAILGAGGKMNKMKRKIREWKTRNFSNLFFVEVCLIINKSWHFRLWPELPDGSIESLTNLVIFDDFGKCNSIVNSGESQLIANSNRISNSSRRIIYIITISNRRQQQNLTSFWVTSTPAQLVTRASNLCQVESNC